MNNESKAKEFYKWLGQRFNTFEIASEGAPISFLAKDHEAKEYYIHVEMANEKSVVERQHTGIKIANTQFYHLYAMASQGSNVFWFEAFPDGYMIFYINECLEPEQLKVTEEYTMIGVSSALHVELPKSVVSADETSYVKVINKAESFPIVNSLELPKAKINKRKK